MSGGAATPVRVTLEGVRAIVLDIEGTTSAISYVYDVLFPFARRRLASFLELRWSEPAVAAIREQIYLDAGASVASSPAELGAHLLGLMDRDAKTTGLKQLQGLIWEQGYAAGELRSHVFDDVPRALERWRAAGLDVAIYSSGSVAAQRVFFAHTPHGDLTPHFCAYFDTTSGPKREEASYRRLADRLSRPGRELLFCSDVVEELDAAAAAGWQTLLVVRPGNRPAAGDKQRVVSSFDQLSIR